MTSNGPLADIRLVEMAGLAPAPFGCMILADLGADVIRIDRAGDRGDALTALPGPLDRGKRVRSLDAKDPEQLNRILQLVDDADVFVEGFRPGVAERLGLGPDVLCERNPRLVYGRMTGWGQVGPLAEQAGHDINYIALAGALEPIRRPGQAPLPPLNLVGDFAGGGMLLVVGILAALQERTTSGRGQVVDAAMVDGASLLMSFLHGLRACGGWEGEPGTNLLDGGAPFYGTYECADGGYVAVGCVEWPFYQQLLAGLGIDEEVEGLDFQLDRTGWDRARQVIADRFRQHPRDEWARRFAGSDACVTPVLSPWEAAYHPHHVAREAFITVGDVVQPAPAPRFSRSPAATPAPLVEDPDAGW